MVSIDEKYRSLIEFAPDPIFLIDPASATVVEANEEAAELLGYDQSTLEGMDVTTLHPSGRAAAYRSLFERTIDEGEVQAESLCDGDWIYLVARNGGRIPVELHARTIEIEGETLIYTIARDITRLYEREHELHRQRDRFEQFADVVSHDLRNPLGVADGYLRLAREECDSDYLDGVAQALDRMDALIDDLLTLAREGDQVSEVTPIDLAEVCRTSWQHVETTESALVTETTQTVRADRSRLQQLLENLSRNAVEHGGDDVTITVGDLDDGFYVEDDGRGIPSEDQDQVFEAGYSSSETGTGIGLSIVEQVATAHGWDILVTDGADGGARFEITGVETV